MQRLNIAQQERLTKWLASEREFKRIAGDVRHEAQVMAMIASVIARKEFDYWDDGQFAAYAKELQTAATEMADAADAEDYAKAQQAVGRATKACADCHKGYRG
jgi:cytochrome c556